MGALVYLFRHGETEWSRTGRHTGRTDIPLTEVGREQARLLRPVVSSVAFDAVFSSPSSRARETAALAGISRDIQLTPDLFEWDYGDYEGLTGAQIHARAPGWTIWDGPCPHGETIGQVAARADAVVAHVLADPGTCAVFSHGHFLRVFAARWLAQPPETGRFLILDTGTFSVLGFEHTQRAIQSWNAPCRTPSHEGPVRSPDHR